MATSIGTVIAGDFVLQQPAILDQTGKVKLKIRGIKLRNWYVWAGTIAGIWMVMGVLNGMKAPDWLGSVFVVAGIVAIIYWRRSFYESAIYGTYAVPADVSGISEKSLVQEKGASLGRMALGAMTGAVAGRGALGNAVAGAGAAAIYSGARTQAMEMLSMKFTDNRVAVIKVKDPAAIQHVMMKHFGGIPVT